MRRTSMTMPYAVSAAMLITACGGGPDRVTSVTPRPSPSRDVGLSQPPTYIGYVLSDISGGARSLATDINEHGWVVGSHDVGGRQHGFIRHADGTVEDIPPLSGDVSNVVTGINDLEQVVGTSTAPDGTMRAWFRAPFDDVKPLWSSWCNGAARANAIDNGGTIAGSCGGQPTYWPTFHDFPQTVINMAGALTDAVGIEPVGYVVHLDGTRSALAYGQHGSVFPIMPSGTTSSWINGTNGSHSIVGGYTLGGVDHGFFATSFGGAIQTLPHVAYGISGQGRIVGWSTGFPAAAYTIAPNAFVETPLPPTSLDRVAVRVNRCGSIVGHYFPFGVQGGPRAALWTKTNCD